MKKFIYSFIALATTAMTFTSCEDVPMPYNYPTDDEPEVVVTDPEGSGTAADPYNVAAIIQIAENLESGATSTEKYYIKGIISRITEEYSTEYGNATFYISDDGSTNNQFYVYRALYLSNASFKSSDTQIKLGDEVVIYGQITNYNGTIETVQKAAYLYSLNGEGGGADKNTGVAEGDGTLENPFNASAANQFGSKLASGAKSDKPVYIKGKVASIAVSSGKEQNYDSGFGNASFYISEDG
ncbi:MAG: hypothetical protein IJ726_01525, partial [Phocaeicola sp.]|nr:hypothetical protein [Phocaeicola sp.]